MPPLDQSVNLDHPINPDGPSGPGGTRPAGGTGSPRHLKALEYASRRIAIFPCVVNGKRPAAT